VCLYHFIIPLTPNDHYSGRTAPLTSKRCILYIYSTNIVTKYFKHSIKSLFFSLKNVVFFHNSNVFGSCIIHILYTVCAKIKKSYSGAKRLNNIRGACAVLCCHPWAVCNCNIPSAVLYKWNNVRFVYLYNYVRNSFFGRASDLYLCLYNQLFALFYYVFKFLTL